MIGDSGRAAGNSTVEGGCKNTRKREIEGGEAQGNQDLKPKSKNSRLI